MLSQVLEADSPTKAQDGCGTAHCNVSGHGHAYSTVNGWEKIVA